MDKSTYVTINGIRVANLISVSSSLEREHKTENGKIHASISSISVNLKRALYSGAPTDGVNIRTLSNFVLKLHTPLHVSTFSGCEWISFNEKIEENRIIEDMQIAAPSYSVAN